MDIKIPRADTMRFNHSATLIQRDPNLTKWILIDGTLKFKEKCNYKKVLSLILV